VCKMRKYRNTILLYNQSRIKVYMNVKHAHMNTQIHLYMIIIKLEYRCINIQVQYT
jgi:hypothetical protein